MIYLLCLTTFAPILISFTLVWAIIGLIVIFISYALVRFVLFDVIQAPAE
jgi:hypothetical protein